MWRVHSVGRSTALVALVLWSASCKHDARDNTHSAQVGPTTPATTTTPAAPPPDAQALAPLAPVQGAPPACIRARAGGSDDEAILAAVIPSYLGAPTARVKDCAGDTANTKPMDRRAPDAGAAVATLLAKNDLGGGRLAAFVATATYEGACDSEDGFLAIVRLEPTRVLVDAVSPWSSHCRGPYALSERSVGSRIVWVETEGPEGTGAGRTDYESVYTAQAGKLVLLKEFVTETSGCQFFDDKPMQCDTSSGTLSFEPSGIVFSETKSHQTCPDDGAPCTKKTEKGAASRFTIEDDPRIGPKLVRQR